MSETKYKFSLIILSVHCTMHIYGILFTLLLSSFYANAQEPKLIIPVGHTQMVNTAMFSPDGRRFVTASDDGTANIWDSKTGALLAELRMHTKSVRTAIFSPDGKTILTASADSTAKIWDAQTGILLFDLRGHTSALVSAWYSPDGKKIVTASDDNTPRLWDAETGKLLFELKGHKLFVESARFSPDGKLVVSGSGDLTVKIWSVATGTLIRTFTGHEGWVRDARFSHDSKKIVSISSDLRPKIYDVQTGSLILSISGDEENLTSAEFSQDDKYILINSRDESSKIWDAVSGKLFISFTGHRRAIRSATYSPDGKLVVTTSADCTARIWNAVDGKLLQILSGHTNFVMNASFSSDSRKLATASADNSTRIWDVATGTLVTRTREYSTHIRSAFFYPNGKKILIAGNQTARLWNTGNCSPIAELKTGNVKPNNSTLSPTGALIATSSDDGTIRIWSTKDNSLLRSFIADSSGVKNMWFSPDGKMLLTDLYYDSGKIKIWDVESGKSIFTLVMKIYRITTENFSPDSKRIVLQTSDKEFSVYQITTGKILFILGGHEGSVSTAQFSPDGKKIVTASMSNTLKLWNSDDGSFIRSLMGNTEGLLLAKFSPDSKTLATRGWKNNGSLWDVESGELRAKLIGHSDWLRNYSFSPDSKKILSGSDDHTAKLWDVASGKLLATLKGHANYISDEAFSPDGKKIVTISADRNAKVWDADKGTLMYTFFSIDTSDYIIFDKDNHYDGSEGARKLLYYSCGTELIELQQLKDKLWVPGLAEKINNGEKITSDKLSDLDICGLTPLVEPLEDKTGYRFRITPQRGGLGETVLFINNIETKKFQLSELEKKADHFELFIPKETIKQFLKGNANRITIKSFTKLNDFASRGADGDEDEVQIFDSTPPNFYAVIIGVSDYKGTDLDLKFAAKDASDISKAISLSSTKLLGKEHVFVYTLQTGKDHDQLPEKKNIHNAFIEIGKKAGPNDILMVFFAGHGVVEGEQKQFYFLTADAAASSLNAAGMIDAGIGAEELMEWIKPANIKAQKRFLILDACNSGTAVNQMVNIGKDQGYVASRDDEKTEALKQIERLKDKSGFYVLSASASHQSAYEMGRYSQGVLTYSLLKAIKEHPEILEDNKFLNVSGWFTAAVKIVTGIVRESNNRQDPQLVTNNDFNIGVVDKDVLSKIILPDEKPLFASSHFQNNDNYDALGLGKDVNAQLYDVSARNVEGAISYNSSTESPDAYSLNGGYVEKGDLITVKVNIILNSEPVPKYKFSIQGKKSDIKELADRLVTKAIQMVIK